MPSLLCDVILPKYRTVRQKYRSTLPWDVQINQIDLPNTSREILKKKKKAWERNPGTRLTPFNSLLNNYYVDRYTCINPRELEKRKIVAIDDHYQQATH